MISLSTHTLDSSNGSHAAGVNVKLLVLKDSNKIFELWSRETDEGGRLKVEFAIDNKYHNCDFQLSFDIGSYFPARLKTLQAKSVSISINLPDHEGVYHIPIIISPHGASLWWST